MMTEEEAEAEYERVFGPLRQQWQTTESKAEYARLNEIRIREHEKANRVREFWQANPSKQLCMVAQEIAKEEVRDVEP